MSSSRDDSNSDSNSTHNNSILEQKMSVREKKSKVPRSIRQERSDKVPDKGHSITLRKRPLTVKQMIEQMKCNSSANGSNTCSEDQSSLEHQPDPIFQKLNNNFNIILCKSNRKQLFSSTANNSNNYTESESEGSSSPLGHESSTTSEGKFINRPSISTNLHSEVNKSTCTLKKISNRIAPPELTVEAVEPTVKRSKDSR